MLADRRDWPPHEIFRAFCLLNRVRDRWMYMRILRGSVCAFVRELQVSAMERSCEPKAIGL